MKMTGVDRLFVDTNVLIYATNESSPWHGLANAALQKARQLGIELVISTQVLREYLATATRLNATGSGIPLMNIFENLQTFQREFTVVEDTRSVAAVLENLARSVAVAGKQVHDANIVAAMQVYGIRHLLTNNGDDFARFAQFIIVVPLEDPAPQETA
jgi:predicted nucleic acid-binding protein